MTIMRRMSRSLLTSFALIAALVLSQAVYADHSLSHRSSSQGDCQVCLQASAAGAALPCTVQGPVPALLVETGRVPATLCATARSVYLHSQQSRAPPSHPR